MVSCSALYTMLTRFVAAEVIIDHGDTQASCSRVSHLSGYFAPYAPGCDQP